ncbi:MAG: hypothetical protein QMD12_03465 [Candidatus Aenigmarchaeota archaeon]|nr:hypothetical protein [Candidatus Aenigmarchaeota archaeon]
MMQRRMYRKEGYVEKIKKSLGKYVPKPGLAGGIGAIVGAGIGSTVGFLGSAAHYLLTEGCSYLLNGGGADAILKTYEHSIRAAGEWGLIGGLGGMILFAKFRDTIYNFLGLKE